MRRNSNSLSRLSPPTREESDAIFKLLDVDGDGALDILEIRRRSAAATLAKAGVHASVSTLAFFSTGDGNLDKLLDAAEVRRRLRFASRPSVKPNHRRAAITTTAAAAITTTAPPYLHEHAPTARPTYITLHTSPGAASSTPRW